MASITLPWVERNPERLSSQRRTALWLLYGLAFVSLLIGLASWMWLAPMSGESRNLADWKIPFVLLLAIGPLVGFVTFLTAGLVVTFYRAVGRILAAPWVAFIIFIGAILGIILLVWVHAEVFAFVHSWDQWDVKRGADTIPVAEIHYDYSVRAIYENGIKGQKLPLPLVGGVCVDAPVLSYALWPLQFKIVRDLVAVGGIIGFISIVPGFGIWWERKIAGRMQS
ncbi:MAG: hypothetical protein KDA33_04580, partial [Phycisphaerales bacterium]|nr:hypothetical protein [Phycisphaerales bacterium]